MADTRIYATGNSRTRLEYDMGWLVLDLGSGHKPHPRADVLVDRFLLDNAERSGQAVSLPAERPFIVADACAMPFKEGAFDFVICSHVAEHVEDVDAFCAELNRVTHRGYLETPSRLAETLRHAPNHRWFVSNHNGLLEFNAASGGYPLGWLGKLFFSFYFYGNIQARGRNVFKFAYGVNKPWHFCLRLIRLGLVWLWLLFRPLTYTRFRWEDRFSWKADPERKRFAQ